MRIGSVKSGLRRMGKRGAKKEIMTLFLVCCAASDSLSDSKEWQKTQL